MNSHSHPDPDLLKIARKIYVRRWTLLAISAIFALVAAVLVAFVPDTYRSEALLAPNIDSGGQNFSANIGQAGTSLLGLAGLALGGERDYMSNFGLEVLRSRHFLSTFIENRKILVPLMAAKKWNQVADELIVDSDVYDKETGQWVRSVRLPHKARPSPLEAYEEFSNILEVTQSKETGFVRISIEHVSPNIASQWVSWLVKDLNEEMRQRDMARSKMAVSFLEQQVEATSLAELRQVFFGLIEEQTKRIMLASISDEYLFITIDPPIAAEEKSRPSRLLIVFFVWLITISFGVTIVVLLTLIREETAVDPRIDGN